MDALNKQAADLSRPAYRASRTIFLWAFFFPPVAMALIQATLNRLMAEAALPPQAA